MQENTSENNEISFLDILLEFTKNLKKISRIITISFLIGLLYVIFTPNRYTATSGVVSEINSGNSMALSSGLSALKSFGLNLGPAGSGLIPETYPKLIKSREVLYHVIQDTFYFKDIGKKFRFVDYVSYRDFWYYLKRFTIKLPQTIYGFLKPKVKFSKINTQSDILVLTIPETQAIETLSGMVSVNLDDETGIITISVTTKNPALSAKINEDILKSFKETIRHIFDQKNSENLKFIQSQLAEAQLQLQKSEEALVQFLERNINPQTIQLQTELDRLKREVDFRANLYNELQIQFAQNKIELKKKEPVIRIVERPTQPIKPSGLGKATTVFLFIFMGFLIGLIKIFYDFIIESLNQDKSAHQKLNKIKEYSVNYFSRFLLSKSKQKEN